MNWTVAWEPAVQNELHQLWATAPDPAAVRTAAETAEQLLGTDPVGNGQHLSEGLWRLRVPHSSSITPSTRTSGTSTFPMSLAPPDPP